jgi:hypothetical protein
MKEWRRKHTRIKCYQPPLLNIPVLLHFPSDVKSDEGWGIILDISLGGIGVETRTPLKTGQTVYVSFIVSENFTFSNTKGIIRHVIDRDIYHIAGVEFDSLVDKAHLQDAIAILGENEPNRIE